MEYFTKLGKSNKSGCQVGICNFTLGSKFVMPNVQSTEKNVEE
jgi:hypothetical protein